VARRGKSGHKMATDEAGSPRHQNAHSSTIARAGLSVVVQHCAD
jgi:hypothetical protein